MIKCGTPRHCQAVLYGMGTVFDGVGNVVERLWEEHENNPKTFAGAAFLPLFSCLTGNRQAIFV